MTAFVAKSFKQADKYIDIDEKIVNEALKWLSTVQAADGSFPEFGQVSHDAMQGGSSKGIALTAYTVIAFLKNKVFANRWHIIKGVIGHDSDRVFFRTDILYYLYFNFCPNRNPKTGNIKPRSTKPSRTLLEM